MDIKEMKSDLRMENFYFSECIINREKDVITGKYEANLQKTITLVGEHTYEVKLELIIQNLSLNISVVANATFVYNAPNPEDERYIIETNTVAIMFPFIRSQVSLLSTQPGMMPIVLPPINTARFKEK